MFTLSNYVSSGGVPSVHPEPLQAQQEVQEVATDSGQRRGGAQHQVLTGTVQGQYYML